MTSTQPYPPPSVLSRRFVRRTFIVGLGLGIAWAAGLFGAFGASTWQFWFGALWFVLISVVQWQGNHWIVVWRRERLPHWDRPATKMLSVALQNLLFSAPAAAGMLLLWFKAVGLPPDWLAIRVVALLSALSVTFITLYYESLYNARQSAKNLLLEKERMRAELEVLRAQVDPHFFFNSLHALNELIETDPERAAEFNSQLASLYHYILERGRHALVPLADEVAFLEQYFELLRIRFEDGVRLEIDEGLDTADRQIPSISLQVLAENAVKHNDHSTANPLTVRVYREGESIVVENARRALAEERPRSGHGLRNLNERCLWTLGLGVRVDSDGERFRVAVPISR